MKKNGHGFYLWHWVYREDSPVWRDREEMDPLSIDTDEMVESAVVDALRFVADTVPPLVPRLLEGEAGDVAPALSMKMRRVLPEATRYAVFLIVARLAAFSGEVAAAHEEGRRPVMSKPRCDVDHTMRFIWHSVRSAAETKYNQLVEWKPLTWNPFVNLEGGLQELADFIGLKHFGMIPVPYLRRRDPAPEEKRESRRRSPAKARAETWAEAH